MSEQQGLLFDNILEDQEKTLKQEDPVCCEKTMTFVCQCVGFRSFWCPECNRVIDQFDCCGHVHEIRKEYINEAAPAMCEGCGLNRIFHYEKKPNGMGEGRMREASIGMARRQFRIESELKNG